MKTNILTAAIIAICLSLTTATYAQDGKFDKTHPRRDQVNDRLANQNKRIHQEVKEGDMSKKRAAQLHRDDHSVRMQERRMAARDHGHITKKDQAILNKRENNISKHIGE